MGTIRSDDQTITVSLHLDARTLLQAQPTGHLLWNAQPKAVAPACQLNLHRSLHDILRISYRTSDLKETYPLQLLRQLESFLPLAVAIDQIVGAVAQEPSEADQFLHHVHDAVVERAGEHSA